MSAGSWAPASCPACARPAYVNQPFLTGIYWAGAALVLGYSLLLVMSVWWMLPLILWLLMLIRCALRCFGELRTTVSYPHERFSRQMWLALLILFPILSAIGILLEKWNPVSGS
jgi:hypothetical protein